MNIRMQISPLILIACYLSGCDVENGSRSEGSGANHFPDISHSAGIDFVHDAGLDGSYFMPESIGAGLALFDHDGDGDLDIYLVNGGPHGDSEGPESVNRLYSQTADGRFVDRTEESGLGNSGYGMGTALGDIDNDGDLDLFVSNYGADALYRNEGGGRFSDITSAYGITGSAWSTSACFLDYDSDGWLDLYVAHYVHDRPARDCTDSAGRREYCGPMTYRGVPDTLWRNEGGNGFSDSSESSGIATGAGRGLGVVSADFTGDGLPDIFVANDGEANNLWVGVGSGRFEDQALMMGVAYNTFGKPEASMGIALGDVNGDLKLDLYVTHLVRETNTLYTAAGAGMQDSTALTGSGAESMPYTGFGTAFFDADHDGDLDLAVANGRVTRGEEDPPGLDGMGPGQRFAAEYGEPNLLYTNGGDGRLANHCSEAGDFCRNSGVSRGLAVGDIDDDGDLDIVVSNGHGPARMYRNDLSESPNWLKVRAVDPELNRDAIGAVVEVRAGARHMVRPVTHCYSYLTSSEAEVHFGLGEADGAESIRVTWPDGSAESFGPFRSGQTVTLERGSGVMES